MKAYVITIPKRSSSAARVYRGLSQVKGLESVTLLVDHDMKGIWWNTARALYEVASGIEPGLIVQDDVLVRANALSVHLEPLAAQVNSKLGMISLFCPPQARFEKLREKGYHGVVGHEFLWAQMYLIDPDFAGAVLMADKGMDQDKSGPWDEVRFRVAAQKFGWDIATLAYSMCSHDISVKSTMGTASKIGKNVRDTRLFANKDDDLSALNLAEGDRSKKDLETYT